MQSTEQSTVNEPIDPLEICPREIWEHILIHLDGKYLLFASHVCKLFASVAETAFAQKYSKSRYEVNVARSAREKPLHEVMLTKYGENIRSIRSRDETLTDLIERKCCKLKNVDIGYASRLPIFQNLKAFRMESASSSARDAVAKFINDNDQLETLSIKSSLNDWSHMLDGRLNMLKKLIWRETATDVINDIPQIRLPSLETLKVVCFEPDRCLHAMTCNSNVTKLDIFAPAYTSSDALINDICAFKSIVELNLACRISNDQIKKLAAHLPHLAELSFDMDRHGPELKKKIQSVLCIVPNLKKLTIVFDFFWHSFTHPTAIYDFHNSFEQYDTELKIFCIDQYPILSTTKDRIFIYSNDSLELYWMNNLNEKNLRKVSSAAMVDRVEKFKFINHCKEHTVDVAAFMAASIEYVKSLEIKSNGPVTVNANVIEFIRLPERSLFFIRRSLSYSFIFTGHAISDIFPIIENTQNSS